jgi:hypothetical protein
MRPPWASTAWRAMASPRPLPPPPPMPIPPVEALEDAGQLLRRDARPRCRPPRWRPTPPPARPAPGSHPPGGGEPDGIVQQVPQRPARPLRIRPHPEPFGDLQRHLQPTGLVERSEALHLAPDPGAHLQRLVGHRPFPRFQPGQIQEGMHQPDQPVDLSDQALPGRGGGDPGAGARPAAGGWW